MAEIWWIVDQFTLVSLLGSCEGLWLFAVLLGAGFCSVGFGWNEIVGDPFALGNGNEADDDIGFIQEVE